MQGRTYRYYEETPLYPFGHGLSYSSFAYGDFSIDKKTLKAGESLNLSLTVKNTGAVPATEIAQVYIRPIKRGKFDVIKNLREFRSVDLKPGETKTLQFTLAANQDFTYYDEKKKAYRIKPGKYEIQVGASSEDIRLKQVVRIK
ncbi:MAG: fibronectin type III-like domain-contianing protein [Cellvibrionaceae bacterium]|nr:fibronectin type III-like domain-contianing protein [Cellvibrionaceae bacterium]